MRKRTLFTALIIFLSGSFGILRAQSADSISPFPVVIHLNIFEELSSGTNGYVHIKGDADIQNLVELHTAINREHKTITGYRIQIFSGSSYDHPIAELQTFKENFEQTFPDIPAYLNYFDPDFKIRVGNFRNRLDCIPTLKKIRRKYPSCYPVKTDIPVSDLDKLAQQKNTPESEIPAPAVTEEE